MKGVVATTATTPFLHRLIGRAIFDKVLTFSIRVHRRVHLIDIALVKIHLLVAVHPIDSATPALTVTFQFVYNEIMLHLGNKFLSVLSVSWLQFLSFIYWILFEWTDHSHFKLVNWNPFQPAFHRMKEFGDYIMLGMSSAKCMWASTFYWFSSPEVCDSRVCMY